MKEYGTLEPLQEEKRTSRRGVLVVIGVLACVAVLGFATGTVKVTSVVDTNRGRAKVNVVDADVQKAFQQVCDRDLDAEKSKEVVDPNTGAKSKTVAVPAPYRFSIAGLKKASHTCDKRGGRPCKPLYSLVPLVSYKATDDWINDWQMFKTFMPSESPAVGYGVYNFPVWDGSAQYQNKYKVYSTFVTFEKVEKPSTEWRKLHPTYKEYTKKKVYGPYTDLASRYLGGTFLGSALLAASGSLVSEAIPRPAWKPAPATFKAGAKRPCAVTAITINQNTNYAEACKMVLANAPEPMKVTDAKEREKMCDAMAVNTCPFSKDDPKSPCCKEDSKVPCKKACESVGAWKSSEQYPAACCAEIQAWCGGTPLPGKGNGKKGCSKRFARAIYGRNCDPSFAGKPTNPVVPLEGLEDETPQCLKACAEACVFFAKNSDTYKKCSGCQGDLVKHKYGKDTFVAKCFAGAHNFLDMRCCGTGAACATSNEKETCDVKTTKVMVGAGERCEWLTHANCGKKLVRIKAAAAKKKAEEEAKAKAAAKAAAAAAAAKKKAADEAAKKAAEAAKKAAAAKKKAK